MVQAGEQILRRTEHVHPEEAWRYSESVRLAEPFECERDRCLHVAKARASPSVREEGARPPEQQAGVKAAPLACEAARLDQGQPR
eukprot:6950529-Prymnesium_polylepis.4